MFKIIINGNCNLDSLFYFDSIATMSGLYNFSSVIIDSREVFALESPLNTIARILLPVDIKESYVPKTMEVLANEVNKGRISCAYFTGDSFGTPTAYIDNYQMVKTLDKNKEISFENLSLTDVDILREYYGEIGKYKKYARLVNPFFATINVTPYDEILLNGELFCDLKEFTIEKSIELFKTVFNNEKLINTQINLTKSAYNIIDEEVNPVFYSDDMFLFNDEFTIQDAISYKKKVFDFIKEIENKEIEFEYLNNAQFLFFTKIMEKRNQRY